MQSSVLRLCLHAPKPTQNDLDKHGCFRHRCVCASSKVARAYFSPWLYGETHGGHAPTLKGHFSLDHFMWGCSLVDCDDSAPDVDVFVFAPRQSNLSCRRAPRQTVLLPQPGMRYDRKIGVKGAGAAAPPAREATAAPQRHCSPWQCVQQAEFSEFP